MKKRLSKTDDYRSPSRKSSFRKQSSQFDSSKEEYNSAVNRNPERRVRKRKKPSVLEICNKLRENPKLTISGPENQIDHTLSKEGGRSKNMGGPIVIWRE